MWYIQRSMNKHRQEVSLTVFFQPLFGGSSKVASDDVVAPGIDESKYKAGISASLAEHEEIDIQMFHSLFQCDSMERIDQVQASEIVLPGGWLCEAVLWTEWEHVGELRSFEDVTMYVVTTKEFCDIISSHAPVFNTAALYSRKFLASFNRYGASFSDLLPDAEFFFDHHRLDHEIDRKPCLTPIMSTATPTGSTSTRIGSTTAFSSLFGP